MERKAVKTVFVGLSGGVDSSVSAALLKEQGYNVVGVFLKTWHPDFLPCTWKEERLDAMRVAAHLGIPFLTFDLEEEYKREVADYLIREYALGRTPNPDVMCNRAIKFGAFMRRARELGADCIATGHYAQITHDASGRVHLAESADTNKDQTYFLWMLGQDDLAHTLFPVGGMTKDRVRALARRFNLPTAEKKDSQGVCFLGMLDMQEFLAHFVPQKPGTVLDVRGERIGTHDGALSYTLGQRHGFHITKRSPRDLPLYVIAKDMERNTITVAEEAVMYELGGSTEVRLIETNWIGDPPAVDTVYTARGRYRGERLPCTIVCGDNNTAHVLFTEPVLFAPGQSLVLYDDNRCMGGGVIA